MKTIIQKCIKIYTIVKLLKKHILVLDYNKFTNLSYHSN